MSDKLLWRQAFNLLCDEKIGAGMSRTVFSSLLLPDCVIKTEDSHGKFQNVIEWETWRRVVGTPASRWFAECKWISGDGSILIMERTRPPAESDYPTMMPVFLSDFKRKNYGMALTKKFGKGVLVCHDYGTHLMFDHGMSKRMRKADWSDNP